MKVCDLVCVRVCACVCGCSGGVFTFQCKVRSYLFWWAETRAAVGPVVHFIGSEGISNAQSSDISAQYEKKALALRPARKNGTAAFPGTAEGDDGVARTRDPGPLTLQGLDRH